VPTGQVKQHNPRIRGVGGFGVGKGIKETTGIPLLKVSIKGDCIIPGNGEEEPTKEK